MSRIALACTLALCASSLALAQEPSEEVRKQRIRKFLAAQYAAHPIDPRFERYRGGSLEAELGGAVELFDVIQGFVRRSYQKRAKAQRGGARPMDLAKRDVHRKQTAWFVGRLTISPELPARFRQGLFQPGARFQVIGRASNGHPGRRNPDDGVPDARGLALMFLPVDTDLSFLTGDGAALADPAAFARKVQQVQDAQQLVILSINSSFGNAFFMDDPYKYAALNALVLNFEQDKWAPLKELAGLKLKTNRVERELTKLLNGTVILNPLYTKYSSLAPFALGTGARRTAVKYVIRPRLTPAVRKGLAAQRRLKRYYDPTHPSWSVPGLATLLNGIGKVIPGATSPKRQVQDVVRETYGLERYDPDFLALAAERTLDPRQPRLELGVFVQPYDHERPANTPIEDVTVPWFDTEGGRAFYAERMAQIRGMKPRYAGSGDARRKVGLELRTGRRGRKVAHRIDLTRPVVRPQLLATLQVTPLTPEQFRAPHAWAFVQRLGFKVDRLPAAHEGLGVIARGLRNAAYPASRQMRQHLNLGPHLAPGALERPATLDGPARSDAEKK